MFLKVLSIVLRLIISKPPDTILKFQASEDMCSEKQPLFKAAKHVSKIVFLYQFKIFMNGGEMCTQ